jgi:mannose-6-phosphate isomerase-like protein (cupin superfamily)
VLDDGGLRILRLGPQNDKLSARSVILSRSEGSAGFGVHGQTRWQPPPGAGGRGHNEGNTAEGDLAMLLKPGEGKEIIVGPASMRIKTPESLEGLFIAEHVFPPGFPGPGSHQHPAMAHAFYVLEGRVRFSLDDQETVGEPGTFVYVPANLTHSFGNGGDSPARCLEINVPGGFDRYYAALQEAFVPGKAIDPDLLRDLQRRNGIVPV